MSAISPTDRCIQRSAIKLKIQILKEDLEHLEELFSIYEGIIDGKIHLKEKC